MRKRHLAFAGVVLLVAAACQPIVNAPPGAGEVVTETFRIGPFDLSAMGQQGDEDEGFQFSLPRPAGAFGMKEISFDLVNEDGTSVARPDAHLHHIVMMNLARQSTYCESTWPERFAATGNERTRGVLPDPYAYMVGAGDNWGATWHVMNMTDQPMRTYIEYEVQYQPGANAENSRPATPFFLDVTGCGNSRYDVPGDGGPDSVHTNTRTWQVPWDGYLVGADGHVHERGISIALRDESTGAECKMNAIYDDGGGHGHGDDAPPHEITKCPIHLEVDQGQAFSVVTRYHNDVPVDGAMGIVFAWGWQGSQ